jgi:hypothetical protein
LAGVTARFGGKLIRGREEEERKKMGYLPYLSTETWTLLVAVITLIVV